MAYTPICHTAIIFVIINSFLLVWFPIEVATNQGTSPFLHFKYQPYKFMIFLTRITSPCLQGPCFFQFFVGSNDATTPRFRCSGISVWVRHHPWATVPTDGPRLTGKPWGHDMKIYEIIGEIWGNMGKSSSISSILNLYHLYHLWRQLGEAPQKRGNHLYLCRWLWIGINTGNWIRDNEALMVFLVGI